MKNFEDTDSFQDRKLITEGCVKNIGYYTVDGPSEKELLLESGERYAVMLYLDTPEAIHPMAIEYASGEGTKDVILTDGEGYISVAGENWQCVEETFSCNLCIKVYTNDHSKS